MDAPAPPHTVNELLIPSLTPQNLERGDLWFSENKEILRKAVLTHPWWRNNLLMIEKDVHLKPSELSRKFLDLGYTRSSLVKGKGVFAFFGGTIEIWPIQENSPFAIEFKGNTIEEIYQKETRQEIVKPKIFRHNLKKLEPGSFVVHVDHGIGIFRGLTSKNSTENFPSGSAFFVVEYAPLTPGKDPDRLYVPVDQEERLSPYVGFETPKIHRLGGNIWFKTKRKAREDAEKLAKELLALYAKREQAERPLYPGDFSLENSVRDTFSFVETEDQKRAEEEIIKDLSGTRPMDRILCGDVGFGKTEIALRAALRVITSGKQVALLSPTTILASQHEQVFRERFKNIPLEIRLLSRLTSKIEEKKTIQELGSGKIDCIIGTHRLLSKDIEFKSIGLVIIDEEQRFGVKQKEKFKNMREEIDMLSLSATPIPRTLSLALARLRDISLLSTPPPERLPITTLVLPYTERTVKEALAFELFRGGQIYFLHNRVETIGKAKERIQKILKSIKIPKKKSFSVGVIHGRMNEKELIRTMEQFREGNLDILLATTIIENGLDISSANTIIVEDATRLGLAQAHQLRGRIGRGAIQGFAYFLYRPHHLSDKAGERLEALREYSELGSGYDIALRDLEIRGAGNILGKEQSGTINRVGLNLYCQMLADAIDMLR